MASTDTCTQSTDPKTNDEWVAGFRKCLENRDRIIGHGQFAFASMYLTELDQRVTKALADDAELRTKLTATSVTLKDFTPNKPGSVRQYQSYAGGLARLAIDCDRANFLGLKKAMKAEIEAHRPVNSASKAKAAMLALVDNSEEVGHSVFYDAINRMRDGQLIGIAEAKTKTTPDLPATKNFSKVFSDDRVHFPGALRIYETADEACGDMAHCVAMYLRKHGAPKCAPSGSPPRLDRMVSEANYVDFGLPLCTLLRSTANLAKTVAAIRVALHRGFTVRAGVISGTHVGRGWVDKPLLKFNRESPDHYLLIIGYEAKTSGIEFVFWDPDAAVSPFHGEGFGHLYFVDKKDCGPQAADVHANGRFTTAPRGGGNANLKVDKDGEHLTVGIEIFDVTTNKQTFHSAKRYQVVFADAMLPIPPKKAK